MSRAGEFINFFSSTIASRTPRGTRQSVDEEEFEKYVGHVYTNLEGLSCVVFTDREYPARVAFGIINRVLEEFARQYSREVWTSATRQLDFPILAEYLQKYQDPEKADPIMRVQRELDETKDVLHNTISSLLERGEKLDDLVQKSDQLGTSSKAFFKNAKKTNSCCVVQ